MNACKTLSRMDALRWVILPSLLLAEEVFVEAKPANRAFRPRQMTGDDTDDEDEDEPDEDEPDEDSPNSVSSTHSNSMSVYHSGTLPDGWTGSMTGGYWSTHSLGTGGPTVTGSNAPADPSETASFNGGNSALATGQNGVSGGAIGGIVVGIGSIFVIAVFLFRRMRRRRAMKERREMMRKDLLLGPPYVRSTNSHPADTKDPEMVATANESSSRRPGPYHPPSRDTLPQIPFDTPAYMSTDNLASYAYAQAHLQRTSTVLSYVSPDSTTVRESIAFGHASLHEDMVTRQKELEARMEQMHESPSSDWNHSISTMNPPPPQYHS